MMSDSHEEVFVEMPAMKSVQPSSDYCVMRLKVLADATRLSVIETLMGGPRHVGELGELLHVEQSLLSHHLKVLREAGLVTSSRHGKAVLYQLARDVEASTSGKAVNLGCCQLSFDMLRK